MDAVSAVVTQPAASSATVSAITTTTTTIPSTSNAINVNQSNNHIHSHTNTHSATTATTNSNNQNNSNISINGGGVNNNSSNSNSSCSSSSTSSNSSGYGSTTTTPTNNYELQQQTTTPTTTPIPTTPVAIAEPIIPVATVAAVTPFYNESITSHNLETHQLQQHHSLHTQQQHPQHLQQQQQHHLLQPQHHQLPQHHLQTNLQQQQYLSRQQYYSTYDYQQAVPPTHNISNGSSSSAPAYNLYDISASPYGSGQYKSSSLTATLNYERGSTVRTNVASYNPQQQQQTEQHQTKTINQQIQPFPAVLATSKQRTSSLIGSSTSTTNTSKPQAAATPFYAQPLAPQSHTNPTPFYDNTKYKMPLEYHDSYSNPSAAATASAYHQQQKYYAAAKSQLKEAGYGTPPGLANSKSVYANTGNYFPTAAPSYDKYMYPHAAATGYTSSTGHLGNETPPDVGNYRKPVGANSINSPSWPWGIDYASGNSRTIPPPPPASHLPTATVAPTHATYLTPNPSALARDPYYMGPEKYPMKYDKYAAASYQQSYVSPPGSRHHIWPNTPQGSNLTQLNERHMLASGPTAPPPTHGLHSTPYYPANPNNGLNSRQSCCSQPYQPQSCYYPPSHAIPPRLPHNQTPTAAAPSSAYLSSQTTLGQSPHLNALSASCKYGGIIPDYGNGNKMKNSNDLYLNAHHYDTNTSPHNYGYGTATAHSSQQLYASNAHQTMAHHGLTPSSLLTHDPLNANPASYTNDLSLTTSNFDNYHTHLDTHLSPPTLAGIHSQQPPPAYGPTVAKRALLDYRKPIQPQPPPTIAEECYTTLSSRDHYNQQELLNTPETTTTFGEYETHQNNAASLTSFQHSTEVLQEADKTNDEGNKNLSLRDFIANWNDDEDEYQNAEELNFDQSNVIDEVLQTAPVEQEAPAAATAVIQKSEIIKTSKDESINKAESKVSHKSQENLDNSTLNESYVNLPDIVIDIEKSNNVNNSITTPSTSPLANTPTNENNTSLNLNNFDVEKELDELKLKKPTQQLETTKDLNDIKAANTTSTPQLSPCKNLTTQLSFEDLNLEPTNKNVLNGEQSSELTENYFKDMEGYESGSSHHSNESAFEKEYETFINKITSEPSTTKSLEEKSAEMDFEQNVQDFSKFYKRKRKLKEDELKANEPEAQNQKKLKPNKATKVNNNSNFPQVYTKKSRNRLPKGKIQTLHKRKPLSLYYKIIHSIRRFGLYRLRRVREYMSELKEKHLPLIKRQSIKNYTHDKPENLTNPKTLKALCIMAINSEEFRQMLMLTLAVEGECALEAEEKHICTDPTCETCEVIKSLMEAESFEDTLSQQVAENPTESVLILSDEVKSETLEILENVVYLKDEPKLISNDIENVQYSKENPTVLDAKVLEQCNLNPANIKSLLYDNSYFETQSDSQYQSNIEKSVTEFDLKNWYEKSKSPQQDLAVKEDSDIGVSETVTTKPDQHIPLNPEIEKETSEIQLEHGTETAANSIKEISLTEQDNLNLARVESEPDDVKQKESVESLLVPPTTLWEDENSNISNATTTKKTSTEVKEISKSNTNEESDSEESDSSESDSDSSSSSSDDESVEESKESCKKSDTNDTDTDSESDLENDDDENLNSNSDESNHSKTIDQEKDISDNKEVLKPADSFKKDNVNSESENQNSDTDESNHSKTIDREKNKSDSNEVHKTTDSFNKENFIKESENVHTTNTKSPIKTVSDVEDEITPKRQQRIVLRIKKSFQPSPDNNDSREIYVSEKSIEFDSQTESESEDDDIVSTTSKSSLKTKASFIDQASNKSLSPNTEFENHTESESEDDNLSENEFHQTSELSPKQDIAREKSVESEKELGNQTESESDDDDDDVSEKETETPFTSPKQNEFVEHRAQSESEDDEIPEKKSKLVAKFPTQEHYKKSNASEKLKDPMENFSKDDNIPNRTSVIISTSLILSPQQDRNTEDVTKLYAENQIEKETEEADKKTEISSTQDDLINDNFYPKSSEPCNEPVSLSLGNEIKDLIPLSQNLLNEEKSEDLLKETSKFSPEVESSEDIVANEKSTEYRTENLSKGDDITQNISRLNETPIEMNQKLDDVETETFSKEESSQHAKPDIPTESQSEDDTDAEEDDLEEPIQKPQLKDADHRMVPSDSESSSYSEYESDEEDNRKDSMPIMISDDESMDSTDAKDNHQQPTKCIRKISEDSFQRSDSTGSLQDFDEDSHDFISEIHSNLSSNIVNSPKMSKSDSKDEILPATQTLITSENIIQIAKILEEKEVSNNAMESDGQLDSDIKCSKENLPLESVEETLEEKQVSETIQSDEKPITDIIQPKENPPMESVHTETLVEDESNNSDEIPEEFSSNINSPKEVLPLDSVKIKETQNIESETASEKSISEYSSTSEDSDEEIDEELSTNKTEEVSEMTLDNEDRKSAEEVEDTLAIKEDKQTEEDLKMSVDIEEQKSISSKRNSNDFECNECLETNASQDNTENEVLPKSEALSKESNTFEQNSKISDVISTQTDPEEMVNALNENIPVGICENLEILADVVVNHISAENTVESKMIDSECDPKPVENYESNIQKDADNLTLEINDSIQQLEAKESEIYNKSIIEEQTEVIAYSDKRSKDLNLEKARSETSDTFGSTSSEEQSISEINDSIHQHEAKESEINSKSIIEEPTEVTAYSKTSCDEYNLEKLLRETSDTCSEEQSTAEVITDEENISGTKTVEFEEDESNTIVEKTKPLSESSIENADSSVVNSNEHSKYFKEICSLDNSNTEIETDNHETIKELVTVEPECLEKVNSEEILDEESEITSDPLTKEPNNIPYPELIKENAEIISEPETNQISEESNDINSLRVIPEKAEIISEMETKVSEIVSKQIPNDCDILENSNNQLNENSGNTCELRKALNEETIIENSNNQLNENSGNTCELRKALNEETIIETHTLAKSVDEDFTESLEQICDEKETEYAKTVSEEESSKQISEVVEEKYEETNKFPNTWDDTDIFKEVNQECLESIEETFDKIDSNDSDITIKEPKMDLITEGTEIPKENETTLEALNKSMENLEEATAAVTETSKIPEENETPSEVISQRIDNLEEQTANLEEPESENTEIRTTSECYESITDIFQSKSEAVILKPNRLIEDKKPTSERYEESGSVGQSLTKPESFIENANNLIKTSDEERDPIQQHQATSDDVIEKQNISNEEENNDSECYEEESMALQEDLAKSEVVLEQLVSFVEHKTETSEVDAEESEVHAKFESPVVNSSSLVEDKNENTQTNEEETEVISKVEDELIVLNGKTDEELTVEHQMESLHENIVDNNNITQEVNKIRETFDQKTGSNQITLPKVDELSTKNHQTDEDSTVEHQTETSESIPNQITLPKADEGPNDSLSETVLNKDNQEDLSQDFLGFKNQSSFEDESEDFHGFEDLEEVTRIRQEIENLNDDSTANDGFLNYGTLSREQHKTSTTSLTGSTSSEINELEALEKELSQHQPEIVGDDEEEDKQTEQDVQTATVKVVSTNDIEHIKQMLESDEEQPEQEENGNTESDKEGEQTTRADTSKDKSKYILSSVNSIIPKLSDLCRAALNSSLNSNSNLAQDTTETSTILVERELSVEEALAEMYRQAGVLLSDPEDCDNDISPSGDEEAHDVLLINLQEILNSDNNDVYVLQCDMNENVLNVVQQTNDERNEQEPQVSHEVNLNAERVNRVQFIGILDTQSAEPQIHIISSDSESEVIILSDDESDNGYRPFIARPERITIPFINDGNDDINDTDNLSDISTIHHEEIVPDNLNKFLQEEFYKYLHEKYVQRNISKYYHANRVLKKYRKRYIRSKRQ